MEPKSHKQGRSLVKLLERCGGLSGLIRRTRVLRKLSQEG
jgi:hypothetical protein